MTAAFVLSGGGNLLVGVSAGALNGTHVGGRVLDVEASASIPAVSSGVEVGGQPPLRPYTDQDRSAIPSDCPGVHTA